MTKIVTEQLPKIVSYNVEFLGKIIFFFEINSFLCKYMIMVCDYLPQSKLSDLFTKNIQIFGDIMLNRKGFTLVELMIVVAIIGILAAIAIPNFVTMQYKTKRSEVPTNLKAIKTAEIAYESNFDVFVTATAYPSAPSKTTQTWTKSASGGFATLGWAPDGEVRGSYSVSTTSQNFTAMGTSDVDGDGTAATFQATKSTNANAPTTGPDVY